MNASLILFFYLTLVIINHYFQLILRTAIDCKINKLSIICGVSKFCKSITYFYIIMLLTKKKT